MESSGFFTKQKPCRDYYTDEPQERKPLPPKQWCERCGRWTAYYELRWSNGEQVVFCFKCK